MDNIPELRFSEFENKLSTSTLGHHTHWRSGGTPSKSNPAFWDGDIPWISAISMHGSKFGSSSLMVTNAAIGKGAKLVPKDTILLLVRGSMLFNRIPVGITTREVTFNQDVKAVSTSDDLDTYFLFYWLKHYENRLLNLVTGTGIGAGKLDTQQLQSLKISIPEPKEQQKIAHFLSSADDKISLLTEKQNLLKRYKKGVMQKLFSQELRFKDEHGNDFPDWEVKKLGDIATFSKGKGISKTDIDSDGQTPCVRYGELYTTYNEVISKVGLKTNLDKTKMILSMEGDVLIPSSGETQLDIATASCILLDDILIGGDLIIVRSSLDGSFLSYYLNSHKKLDLARLSQGSSVIHLYASHFKILKIDVPTLKEQQKIANFLSETDKKINSLNQQIEQTKTFKKGLLQKMFV